MNSANISWCWCPARMNDASVAIPHWLFLLRDMRMYPLSPQVGPQEFFTM